MDFAEISTLEGRIREELIELSKVAPIDVVNAKMKSIVLLFDKLESLLRKTSVDCAIKESIEESKKGKERIKKHQDELKTLHAELRALRPTLKINAEKQIANERERLLFLDKEENAEELAKRTDLKSAERATNALQEAGLMMRHEVQRMQAAYNEVEDVSDLIVEAISEQKQLEGGVKTGRGLITRLERREITDRILIAFAFAVFFLIVAYIVKKRTIG